MKSNPADIQLLVLDVDGVLTDAKVLLTEEGHQLRSMSIKDGFAIKYALGQGLRIAVISGARSEGVRKRLNGLGVHEVHLGIEDKWPVMEALLKKFDTDLRHTAYLGDDIPDLEIMQRVALSACPADAEDEVFDGCDYVCRKKGGEGCVRELIKLILASRDQWIAH
jgi:3-deoxy-D-manno-octulosonate 8-phosphate phosphatase (KDO 8-P phosphatase)